ncbi:MAG: hypothetical protein IPO46_06450 [Chitinophagaceae bacterium]|jgi:hypothetical protein|nr:hypothetical protein [Chitinophagaceae bacterium]MBP6045510.1 hypothetical protein [Ferruginibacter sp.]MBK7089037.1 hypothetical protein [Chitinophagaceae bacterium]MBK7347798.1 hypothetical protein [Chitinophagaceae bacterium]MBK7734437.1 hypothetical protein [Chitinophagaceae bacterium]
MKKIIFTLLALGLFVSTFAQRDNLNEQLEQLGQNHNEFLTFIFTKTKDTKLSLCDKKSYKIWNQWAKEFFATKNAKWDGDFVEFYAANKWDEQPLYPKKELSAEANDYLKKLADQIELLNDKNIAGFVIFCSNLQNEALSKLKSDNDAIVVGAAIVIAKYSSQYWDSHMDEWVSYYSVMLCSPKYQTKLSPTEKKILQSDASGAISGAISGIGVPPPIAGSIAGALVSGGFSSCITGVCIGFGIDHITDWLW